MNDSEFVDGYVFNETGYTKDDTLEPEPRARKPLAGLRRLVCRFIGHDLSGPKWDAYSNALPGTNDPQYTVPCARCGQPRKVWA